MTTGYSGTPLARKLSLKAGMRVWFEAMPEAVRAEIAGEVPDLVELAAPEPGLEAAHVFVTARAAMGAALGRLFPLLAPGGFIWISWPKKAAKVPTDMSEDAIRESALPIGLVDVKVCAVDPVWSALKLMRRRQKQ